MCYTLVRSYHKLNQQQVPAQCWKEHLAGIRHFSFCNEPFSESKLYNSHLWNQRLNYSVRTMTRYHIEKCPHRLSVRLGRSGVQDSCLSALRLAHFLFFLL